MSKPILVVRVPLNISNMDKEETREKIPKYIKELVPDYNHIIIIDSSVERLEFEVFNVQDYSVIDFETLKNKLENLND